MLRTFIIILFIITFYQLINTKLLASALNLAWVFILIALTAFSLQGLDLFLSLLFLVYTSVFLFLTLLSVHVANYWSLAANDKNKHQRTTHAVLIIIFLLIINTYPVKSNLFLNLFTTVNLFNSNEIQNLLVYLHIFFYKLFVIEAVLLNVYLFGGLVGATVIIQLRYFFQKYKHSLTQFYFEKQTATQALVIRLPNNIKRQTRRKNTSFIKFIALTCCKN